MRRHTLQSYHALIDSKIKKDTAFRFDSVGLKCYNSNKFGYKS